MNPNQKSEPKVKVAARTSAVSSELVVLIGLVVVLLVGVSIGL